MKLELKINCANAVYYVCFQISLRAFFFPFFLLLEDDDDYDSSCEQVLDGGDDGHWIHHVHDRK